MEGALRERNEALEAADKAKTAFLSRMSYELRTPLTSIGGFGEMLQAGYAGKLADQQRADIDRGAFDRKRSRLALREVEHIVDLAAEHGDRVHDRVDIGALLVAEFAGIARLQHLAEAADRGQRRPQFVTCLLYTSPSPRDS